ncbi:hypothetical protein OZ410_08235 [Robiginitalea sp. M366]|uniref:hypothetical protein n=1 Tax=Robiginitalea aestuariiviva TaxID=3036903 RepID=UPI00240DF57E|nr:hypothetical protein [Robiginitalea aestuariiviva]MDG1572300.1 hypothetical protein [Robiginitalea aestuariiviva]
MFSSGQIAFALFFIVAFTAAMVWVYRSDRETTKKQYKGVGWVLLAFVSFVIILFLLKYILSF